MLTIDSRKRQHFVIFTTQTGVRVILAKFRFRWLAEGFLFQIEREF